MIPPSQRGAFAAAFLFAGTGSAQLVPANGTGGGAWDAGATWAGGAPPTSGQTFSVVAGDTVTARGLGTIQNNTSNSYVYGRLDVGAGTTLLMGRLNSGVTSSGTVNLVGGNMSVSRLASSSTSHVRIAVTSGTFAVTGPVAFSANGVTVDMAGGRFNSVPTVAGTLNLGGGLFAFQDGYAGMSSAST